MAEQAATQQQPEKVHVPLMKKPKKKWVPIVASKEFNQTYLGETYVFESEQAVGKIVEANLMNLTHDAKKQSTKVMFRVHEVKNNQAFTTLVGFEMLNAHVKRLTKKAKSKVDISFPVMTADNIQVRVKPLILTRTRAHHSILTKMQDGVKTWFTALAKQESFAHLMNEMMNGNVPRDMKAVAKKFYPVTTCVVRVAKRLD